MILLMGNSSESLVGYVMLQLLDRGSPFLLLDPFEHGRGFDLDWEVDGERLRGQLRYGDRFIPLSDVRSVFAREVYPSTPQPGPVAPDWSLHAFAETAPVLVVNRPSACASNGSKVYQQRLIAAHGFHVPLTLTTTVPEEADAFYERCGRRVIYKSLSGWRSIVHRLADADLGRLDQVRNCPTQFQEWVPGVDVRVHVVGRRLFASEIETDAVDYRYASREKQARTIRGTELPADVARRCLDLAASLDLVMAGIDLRRDLDGRYYCFEANPCPGFTFYEQYTGQRIGEAVADLLVAGTVA
jgi:glutathione synthase/RimK-type ligase-like ATP-grasp enzyme